MYLIIQALFSLDFFLFISLNLCIAVLIPLCLSCFLMQMRVLSQLVSAVNFQTQPTDHLCFIFLQHFSSFTAANETVFTLESSVLSNQRRVELWSSRPFLTGSDTEARLEDGRHHSRAEEGDKDHEHGAVLPHDGLVTGADWAYRADAGQETRHKHPCLSGFNIKERDHSREDAANQKNENTKHAICIIYILQ